MTVTRDAAYVSFPQGIVLPYYADPGQSYLEHTTVPELSTQLFSYVTPSSQLEIPIWMQFTLTTDATAGNRYVNIQWGNQTSFMQSTYAVASQPPSTSYRYVFQVGSGGGVAVTGLGTPGSLNGVVTTIFPPTVLSSGQGFTSVLSFNGAGDTFNPTVDYTRIVVPSIGEGYQDTPFPLAFDPAVLS